MLDNSWTRQPFENDCRSNALVYRPAQPGPPNSRGQTWHFAMAVGMAGRTGHRHCRPAEGNPFETPQSRGVPQIACAPSEVGTGDAVAARQDDRASVSRRWRSVNVGRALRCSVSMRLGRACRTDCARATASSGVRAFHRERPVACGEERSVDDQPTPPDPEVDSIRELVIRHPHLHVVPVITDQSHGEAMTQGHGPLTLDPKGGRRIAAEPFVNSQGRRNCRDGAGWLC